MIRLPFVTSSRQSRGPDGKSRWTDGKSRWTASILPHWHCYRALYYKSLRKSLISVTVHIVVFIRSFILHVLVLEFPDLLTNVQCINCLCSISDMEHTIWNFSANYKGGHVYCLEHVFLWYTHVHECKYILSNESYTRVSALRYWNEHCCRTIYHLCFS